MNWKIAALLISGLLLGILLGVLVFFSSTPRTNNGTGAQVPPTVGSQAREFQLDRLEGGSQKLSDLKGKPVLLNFWATWCPPCKEEMPLLEKLHQQFGDRLVIVGVDYQEQPDQVRSYVKSLGITFPILMDSDGKVADLYYVKNFPTTFFVDADGVLRGQHLGILTDDVLGKYLKTIGLER